MLPKVLSFVDVETSGLSPKNCRIIEIGIIRVENNKIIEKFQTLINPGTYIDPFILSMTRISTEDLQNAPSFYEVSKKIKELLSGSVFVAHNVLFDYAFIKQEFERFEESFSAKIFCSVKLSKKLYPRFKHHNLDAIIQRHNIACKRRHRAFDDAKVVWDFYKLSLKKFGQEKLSAALSSVSKRPTRPINVSEQTLDSLPQSPGVYIFYNKNNLPLYIGKSKNIRTRVLSHFSDMKIARDINRIESIETAGELGALLLEATLIKKFQPLYNRQLRYASKLLALKKVSAGKYHSVEAVNLQDIPIGELSNILGIFKSKKDLKSFLIALAKEYKLCPKLLGIEKGGKNCFNYHLKLCNGACSGSEMILKYNLRFDEAFYRTKIKDWPFKGPVGIKEKSGKEEIFIVDKWCVLGTLKSEADKMEDLQRDYFFDTDTYKILSRYLKSKIRLINVFQLK